jgi:hypothetical protein
MAPQRLMPVNRTREFVVPRTGRKSEDRVPRPVLERKERRALAQERRQRIEERRQRDIGLPTRSPHLIGQWVPAVQLDCSYARDVPAMSASHPITTDLVRHNEPALRATSGLMQRSKRLRTR